MKKLYINLITISLLIKSFWSYQFNTDYSSYNPNYNTLSQVQVAKDHLHDSFILNGVRLLFTEISPHTLIGLNITGNLSKEYLEIERKQKIINYLKLGNLILIVIIIIILFSLLKARKQRKSKISCEQNVTLEQNRDQETNIPDKDHYIINIQNQLKLYEKLKENLLNDIETLKHEGRISVYVYNKLNKTLHNNSLLLERVIRMNQQTSDNEHYFRSLLLSKYPDLTSSEIEICTFIKLGLTNKEIANLRGTSVNSIKAYKYRIRKKMNLKSREKIDKHLRAM